MGLPKVFEFKIRADLGDGDTIYRAEYTDNLPELHDNNLVVGKKGYTISWDEDGETKQTTYLEYEVVDVVNEGYWVIVNDMSEKGERVMRQKVKINCKFEGDTLPKYERYGDSAMDLRAYKFREIYKGELLPEQDFTEEGYALRPFDRILVPTGLKLELPDDIDADVRPRSGLTLKHGIMVALGTIDSPYTGDVGMIVMNLSNEEFVIKRGDRLGQLKFAIPIEAELNVVGEIHTTNRGENGFGSSGK